MMKIDEIKMEAVFRRLDHLDTQARSLAERCRALAEEAYQIQLDIIDATDDEQNNKEGGAKHNVQRPVSKHHG